jgi:inner membrane protein
MNVVTHLLADWAVAAPTQHSRRDRALVTWAGVAPDLDGLGLIVDFATRTLHLPATDYYQQFHRMYGHGLPGALVIAAAAAVLAGRRTSVFIWSLVAVHLHFLCDILGSRGTGPEDIRPIRYLAPFSHAWTVEWTGQWPLTSWQNTSITIALIVVAFALALKRRVTFCELFSANADRKVVEALLARWSSLTSSHRP